MTSVLNYRIAGSLAHKMGCQPGQFQQDCHAIGRLLTAYWRLGECALAVNKSQQVIAWRGDKSSRPQLAD